MELIPIQSTLSQYIEIQLEILKHQNTIFGLIY